MKCVLMTRFDAGSSKEVNGPMFMGKGRTNKGKGPHARTRNLDDAYVFTEVVELVNSIEMRPWICGYKVVTIEEAENELLIHRTLKEMGA